MSLVVADLRLTLRGTPLFAPVTFTVPSGAVMSIMGRSGIGKSSLLAAIAGHLDPQITCHGTIHLQGTDLACLPPERRQLGMIFQEPSLFLHLSLGDNLAFGLAAGGGREKRRAAVDAALESAGLAGMYGADPDTLSGGQKSRASLMRCLLSQPRALLMDEPFAALDMELRAEMRSFVFAHIRAHNIPAILVTHDPADAEAANGPCITLHHI